MDFEIYEIKLKDIIQTNKSFLFIGNESTYLKDLLLCRSDNLEEQQNGSIVTRQSYNFDFMKKTDLYQGFSEIFIKKIFIEDRFLVLDNINITPQKLENINGQLQDLKDNILFINSYNDTEHPDTSRIEKDNIKYDYIIICRMLSIGIPEIYHKYFYSFIDDYSTFLIILDNIFSDGDILVLETQTNKIFYCT